MKSNYLKIIITIMMLSLAMGTSGCGKNKKSSAATRSLGRSPVGGNPTNSTNGIPNSQLANQTDSLKWL